MQLQSLVYTTVIFLSILIRILPRNACVTAAASHTIYYVTFHDCVEFSFSSKITSNEKNQ